MCVCDDGGGKATWALDFRADSNAPPWLLFKLYGDLNPNTNRRVACYRLRSGSLVAREAYTHIGLTIDACKSVLDDRSSGLRGQ